MGRLIESRPHSLPGKARLGEEGDGGGGNGGVEEGGIKRAAGDNGVVDPAFQLQLGDSGRCLCVVTFSTLAGC